MRVCVGVCECISACASVVCARGCVCVCMCVNVEEYRQSATSCPVCLLLAAASAPTEVLGPND